MIESSDDGYETEVDSGDEGQQGMDRVVHADCTEIGEFRRCVVVDCLKYPPWTLMWYG